jgi:MFS family permease
MVMMISPIIITILAPFSGHLSDKIGSESLTLVGLALMGLGLGLMATLNENSSLYSLIIFIALLAVGNALFLSPNNSLVMSSAPSNKLGIAGSINAFVRNLAQTSGVAMATLLLYSFMSVKMGEKVYGYVEGRSDVFIYGMRYVYIVAAIICVVGVLVTGIRLKRQNKSY